MKKMLLIVLVFLICTLGMLVYLDYTKTFSRKTNSTGTDVDKRVEGGVKISALVLPHFDQVKDKRQNLLDKIQKNIKTKEIILLSVNHFNNGENDIQTTDRSWNLSNGAIEADQRIVDGLVENRLVTKEDNSFETEHGIKNIIPDLAKYLPEKTVTPIIVKNKTTKEKLDNLLAYLKKNCNDCLVVASIDFSHYNPDSLAQLHDRKSLAALFDKNGEEALKSETDSPELMYFVTQWAKTLSDQNFTLVENSNSGQDGKNQDAETTSYVLGYYSNQGDYTKPKDETTFLFAGDMMFDRLIYHRFKSEGLSHIFDDFGNRIFWGTDISFANLEGPISLKPINDNISPDNLIFNFPPETPQVLSDLGVGAVSLANNHSSNVEDTGIIATKKALDQSGIRYVGNQENFGDDSIIRFNTKIPVSVIAVNMLTDPDLDSIDQKIESEKSAGNFVIFFPHWGNEYQLKHNSTQERNAHRFIDSGADMIIGSHPHVVQDIEIYQSKPIIYSLGNFIFDQTFSKDTQIGLLLGGKITLDTLEISFFPTIQKSLKPQLQKEEGKKSLLNRILPKSGFETIRSDTIKLPIK